MCQSEASLPELGTEGPRRVPGIALASSSGALFPAGLRVSRPWSPKLPTSRNQEVPNGLGDSRLLSRSISPFLLPSVAASGEGECGPATHPAGGPWPWHSKFSCPSRYADSSAHKGLTGGLEPSRAYLLPGKGLGHGLPGPVTSGLAGEERKEKQKAGAGAGAGGLGSAVTLAFTEPLCSAEGPQQTPLAEMAQWAAPGGGDLSLCSSGFSCTLDLCLPLRRATKVLLLETEV